MTKKRASSPMRQLLRLVSGLIIIVSIFLCLLAFLRVLHPQSKLPPSFFKSRRSYAFIHEDQFKGPPKVSFLFLFFFGIFLLIFSGTPSSRMEMWQSFRFILIQSLVLHLMNQPQGLLSFTVDS
ncbi:unnamed protein product [Prunus brigantina]